MGVIANLINRLFARTPRRHTTVYGGLYAAIVSRLGEVSIAGVKIGSTAGYPRIEVHSIQETDRLDKEGCVRRVTLTVESMSNVAISQAVDMNDEAMALLTGTALDLGDGWTCFGVVPTLLQDLTETADTQKIIYRLLQQYDFWLNREK